LHIFNLVLKKCFVYYKYQIMPLTLSDLESSAFTGAFKHSLNELAVVVANDMDLKVDTKIRYGIEGDSMQAVTNRVKKDLGDKYQNTKEQVDDLNSQNALFYDIDNNYNIQDIFNHIQHIDESVIIPGNVFAEDTDKIINNIYYLYYDNIKKLKGFRHDISDNIHTAYKLFHKLDNYTNTNSNLHLLSKTKDKLQNKIDSYENHMNIDSQLNKELERNIENNKNYNYYLLIIHYVILILFFIFSNFMKNKYYKNPLATIMIILYIIAPFILKYILLYMYKFYLYIMKKFNLLNTGLTYEDIVKYDSYNYENNQENISYI